MISASYEAIKFQKLDLFSITLRRIGENMVYYEAYDALATIDKPTVNKITYTVIHLLMIILLIFTHDEALQSYNNTC